MKRHPALQPLSRDHHYLLLHARALRWSVEGSRHAAPLEEVVAAFLDYWNREGLLHLREEEEVLLPYPTLPEPALAAQIRAEHEELRRYAAQLAQDSAGEAARLARRLHDHIRFEERVFFQQVQAALSEGELLEIAARSRQFRARWRSP